ncbi:MAG: outer membrane protein assembly factor BamA [Acidobacteriota bacterium]
MKLISVLSTSDRRRADLAALRHRGVAVAVLAAVLLTLFLSATPVLGQAQVLAGRKIVASEVRGIRELAEESVLYYLKCEVGQTWDPRVVNREIKDLWTRELVDDVRVQAEPQGEGVKVIITITERPTLVSLDYQGLDKIKRNDIGDAIDKEQVKLYEGLPLSVGELVRLESVIKSLYEGRGYRFASVDVQTEKVAENELRVLVVVDEGNKVKIGRVDFDGNELFEPSKLRRQMEKTKKSNLLTRIRKRDVYNPATVDEDLEKVRDLYRRYGYKDVVVGTPETEVMQKSNNADAKRRLKLVVPIDEGPRWKLGDIKIEGNEFLADEILLSVFEEPKGGWLRSDVIDEGLEKIQEYYQNTGYIFSRVEPEVIERDDLIADVLIKVEENDQFRVGRIEFDGNSRTRDKVLRRELRLHEGMVFNAGALRNSLLKINQLEYYQLNEDDPVGLDYRAEDQEVDLVIKGDEAERTELQFGGGYSELDGFFGQASIRTRNFMGRGETLGVSLQTGRFREIFDVSYFVPWLFDKPQSFGVQLFDRDTDFDLLSNQRFLQKERGAVITYGRSFRLFESLSFSYTNSDFESLQSALFRLNIDDTDSTLVEQSFAFNKSSLTAQYRYDSHDSRLAPTRGRRINASIEYAGGPLGGQDFFIRGLFNFAYTRPLLNKGLRTIGRVNLNVGYIEPFGTTDDGRDRELFFLDRFLAGGDNTIRGYAFRSIWVRDPITGRTILDENGFPQGGNKLLQINFEHHFVINGPFRVVAFADFVNVYGDDQDFDLDHLRGTAGIELRINVPLFGAPLRFIWSNNLDPLSNMIGEQERFDSFDFSIGTSF